MCVFVKYLFYVDGRNLIRCITTQNRKVRDIKEIAKEIVRISQGFLRYVIFCAKIRLKHYFQLGMADCAACSSIYLIIIFYDSENLCF